MTALRRLWAERDFRWLWLGQTLSSVGDQMIVIILALYVVDRTGSSADLGIVLAAQTAPLVLLILFGGVWADRLSRTRIMIGSDLVRFAVQAVIATLVFTDELPIWLLAVLVACFGAAEAFFRPAYTGLLPQTVPEELIQEAQAVTQMSYNVAAFVGPAIATLFALGAGFAWAYALDALTFLASAALLLLVRARRRGDGPATEGASVWDDLVAGFHEVRTRPWVWSILLVALVVVFAAMAPFLAVGALVARDEYGSTAVFGWMEVATGVGAALGAVIGFRWRPLRPIAAGVVLFALWPLAVAAFALGLSLGMVVPLMVLSGVGLSLFMVWWEAALAQRIPPGALSRVSSYDWMVSLAMLPVGYLLAGFLAERFAPSTVLVAGCLIAFLATPLPLLLRDVRETRRVAVDWH